MASSRSLASALSMVKTGSSRRSRRWSMSAWVTVIWEISSAWAITSGGNSVGMPHRTMMASAQTRAPLAPYQTLTGSPPASNPPGCPAWVVISTLSISLAPLRPPATLEVVPHCAVGGDCGCLPHPRGPCRSWGAPDRATTRLTRPLGPLSRFCRSVKMTCVPQEGAFQGAARDKDILTHPVWGGQSQTAPTERRSPPEYRRPGAPVSPNGPYPR